MLFSEGACKLESFKDTTHDKLMKRKSACVVGVQKHEIKRLNYYSLFNMLTCLIISMFEVINFVSFFPKNKIKTSYMLHIKIIFTCARGIRWFYCLIVNIPGTRLEVVLGKTFRSFFHIFSASLDWMIHCENGITSKYLFENLINGLFTNDVTQRLELFDTFYPFNTKYSYKEILKIHIAPLNVSCTPLMNYLWPCHVCLLQLS
jgi:hypothetical protein